ncbi:hypothetical protein [Actinoplanes subglobosus]|uniref:Uncharacterized protein n=1 Tax=Actinoplanes subglobosus TaxID=1547892 RepID=A0ABV8JCN4_9ACTN
MPGTWDAEIKLLTLVDENTRFTAPTVVNGKTFDVLADVEIGADLMKFVTKHELFVSVLNVSTGAPLPGQPIVFSEVLPPQGNNLPLNREIRLPVAGWKASEGDILKAVASYKVSAGVNTDYSTSDTTNSIVTT